MDYKSFLREKSVTFRPSGFDVALSKLNPMLYDWQKVLVRWALARGRAALFEDCGLGKTPQQLVWSQAVHEYTSGDILILAPLAVSAQTIREGRKFGIDVNLCRTGDDVKHGINITNYDRLHLFDPSIFTGIVLDESGILKNFAGKIRNQIIESFLDTPYKLCCTATPSPNDFTELGNTAEFLGVMTRPEMLSMFFINDTSDTGTWRMKGHVKDNIFWEWLASWSVMMRMPSDIGFPDGGFILPKLNMVENVIPYSGKRHTMFVEHARTLAERREARRESLTERVAMASELANRNGDQWICWCNMNIESTSLTKSIDGAVEITGSDSREHKEQSMIDFQDGKIKTLVTKPKIAGLGMNLQNCSNMAFVGLSDSYEQLYQAVRRCWRFGQGKTTNAHIIIGEREGAVLQNIKRKEADMERMFTGMIGHMAHITQNELGSAERKTTPYNPEIEMLLPDFLMKG